MKDSRKRGTILLGIFVLAIVAIAVITPVQAQSDAVLRLNLSRLVVLDDPNSGTAGSGFATPPQVWGSNYWSGESTTIRGYALVVNKSGGIQNVQVTFTITDPGGTSTTLQDTTDSSGIASFSYNLNGTNYYGYWTVTASATVNGQPLSTTQTFIYNWWGCANCHGVEVLPGKIGSYTNRKSPYIMGYNMHENPKKGEHSSPMVNGFCTACHQGYDKIPYDPNAYNNENYIIGNKPTQYSADIHNGKKTCQDCHVNANTGNQKAEVSGCYDTPGCHPQKNSQLTTLQTTTGYSVGGTYRTIYSYDINSGLPKKAHTSTGTVPCLNCHGPAHNITKPYNVSIASNSYTEDEQCLTCHKNQGRHSPDNPVNCTACHSQDAHSVGLLDRTSGSQPTYTTPSSANAVNKDTCNECHVWGGNNNTNAIITFFNSIANGGQPYATNYYPQNDTFGYNISRHNGTVSCTTCHDNTDFHSITFLNITGSYNTSKSQAVRCQDCHAGNNNVISTVQGKGYNPPQVTAKHNNTVPCEFCHSPSPHGGARFLNTSSLWNYTSSRSDGIKCTDCHSNSDAVGKSLSINQTSTYTINPPQITDFQHGNTTWMGMNWNSSAGSYYWNTSYNNTACLYCHAGKNATENNPGKIVKALHNTSALGNVSKVNGGPKNDLANSRWCAGCHVSSSPNYAGNQYIPAPPTIDTNNTGRSSNNAGNSWFNHSSFISGGYNDTLCTACHYSGTPSNVSQFIHGAQEGSVSGGCISCHTNTAYSWTIQINTSRFGKHADVNTTGGAGNLTDDDCTTCHYDTSNMFNSGWSVSTYDCSDCHQGTKPGGVAGNPPSIGSTFKHGNNSCVDCHVAGGYSSGKAYHYNYTTPFGAVKEPGWSGWVSGTSVSCNDCHFTHSKRDEPFNAPGISRYMATKYSAGCGGSNCHGSGILHNVNRGRPLPPLVSVSLNKSAVLSGEVIRVYAVGIGGTQIYNATYQIFDSDGNVVVSSPLTPDDGEFGGVAPGVLGPGKETFTFNLNTSTLDPGDYTIRVNVEKDTGNTGYSVASFRVGSHGSIRANLDMEAWTIGNTLVNWNLYGTASLASSTDAYNGSYSARLTVTDGTTSYLKSIKINVNPSKDYRVTVWLNGSVTYAGISVEQYSGSTKLQETSKVVLTGTTSGWVSIGTDLTTLSNADNITVKLWVIGNGTVNFDTVNVIPVPSPTNDVTNGGFESNWGGRGEQRFLRSQEISQSPKEFIKGWEPKEMTSGEMEINTTMAIGSRSAGINGSGYWSSPYQDTSYGGGWAPHYAEYGLRYSAGSNVTVEYKLYSDRLNDFAGLKLVFWSSTSQKFGRYGSHYIYYTTDSQESGYAVGVIEPTTDWTTVVLSTSMPTGKNYLQLKLLSQSNNHVLFDEVKAYESI